MTRHRTARALLIVTMTLTVTSCGGATHLPEPQLAPSATTAIPRPNSQPAEGVNNEDVLGTAPVDKHLHPEELDQETVGAAAEAAAQFIAGWSTLDPAGRHRLLEPVASAELLKIFTDPRFQPTSAAPSGPVHLRLDGFQAVARQRLDDSSTAQLVLVLDPTADWGWRVTTIEPA